MLAGTKTRAKSLRGTGGHSRWPFREPGHDGTTDVADAFPDGEAYPDEMWLEAVLIHPGADYTLTSGGSG